MKKICLFITIMTVAFAGCKKFLDVTPRDKQTSEQLFGTKSGFYAASNGVYEGLASTDLYGRSMTYGMLDILAKRYQVITANTYFNDLAIANYTGAQVVPALSSIWQNAYSTILAGNLLIANIDKQTGVLAPNEANIMKGEMLAARAFLHFDMLRLFGPRWDNNPAAAAIPYNDNTEVSVLPMRTFEEVMNKVLSDLQQAETLLANDPVISGGPMASELANQSSQLRYRQFRFNYYAVKALEARVYLYGGNKTKALETAKLLLNDPKVQQHFPKVDPNQLLGNYTNPDRVFSSEVLAGIYVSNRDDAYAQYFSSETAGQSFIQPHANYMQYLFAWGSGQLGASEALQDYRYQSQWEPASGVGARGHVFTKYKPIKGPSVSDPNAVYFYSKMISLIRLSEIYYIAAECEPNVNDKFIWINEMRRRRGMADAPSSLYPAFANVRYLNALLINEYFREFYGEGQVFYLIKRLGANLVANENGQALAAVLYNEINYRPPLPAAEMK